MKLPHNMSCICLPDLKEFESFPTCGPDGLTLSNINGTAAAIECYLDLTYSEYDSYIVRWTNYKKETGMYQGALEFKEYYAKDILIHQKLSLSKVNMTPPNLRLCLMRSLMLVPNYLEQYVLKK
jgi:hypothetical protein